jgi:hypothetical protein
MNERPVILNRREVRELLERGEAEVRRALRTGAVALQVTWKPGDRLWVREGFASRREGDSIRIRYAVDRGQGDARVRVVPIGPGLWRFATKTYRSWPAKYMPREFCRLLVELVEVLAVREEPAGVLLHLKIATAEGAENAEEVESRESRGKAEVGKRKAES